MTATVSWHPTLDHVLLMSITGNATMTEVLDVTAQEGELIKAADHIVHTIIDLSDVEGIPNNFLSSVPRILSMPAASHANSGNKVVVGASGMSEMVLNIFSKVGRKLFMFKTMDEAVAFLQEQTKS